MELEYRVSPYVTVVQRTSLRKNVQKVFVHGRVTAIEADAFGGWTNLKEIVIEPNSRLERIGDRAFAGTALREFTAPKGLKDIGNGAFADCKELKAAWLNGSLENIGEAAF